MSKRHHVKYTLFLSDFNKTWIFSINSRKNIKYQVSSKSVHWDRSCSMRTDAHEAILRTRPKTTTWHLRTKHVPECCFAEMMLQRKTEHRWTLVRTNWDAVYAEASVIWKPNKSIGFIYWRVVKQ
jgi:hypothetical protein